MRHPLHRDHGTVITYADIRTVAQWLDLTPGATWLDNWNRIAAVTGLPQRAGSDTITSEEWNHAVTMALARHA